MTDSSLTATSSARRRPARSILSRCDCSVRTRSTARRRAIVTAHVDRRSPWSGRSAAVDNSTNTSWVTSSDIEGSRTTRLTVP